MKLSTDTVSVRPFLGFLRDTKYLSGFLLQVQCIVTIDAMGCQKAIAKKIRKREADYIGSVLNNLGSKFFSV